MEIAKKVSTHYFNRLGKAALVTCVFGGALMLANQDAIKHGIDSAAFDHLGHSVFQTNHDFMKNSYTSFVKKNPRLSTENVNKEIQAADEKGFFADANKFKAGMKVFEELRNPAPDTKANIQSLREKYLGGQTAANQKVMKIG